MIVAAYTPDAYGRAAVEHASAEAIERGEKLVVVNATTGNKLVDRRFAGDEEMDALRDRLSLAGVDVEVRHDVVEDVSDAVLDAATGARLIVVGIRPRTPVGKMLLGSVAQRVILEARCPVLSVKPED